MPVGPRVPLATYRLQLGSQLTFDAAAGLVPYLAALGISDCYISPFFETSSESSHGYDVSAWAIAHRLDQRARARRRPPAVPRFLPTDPRARDLRVPSHRLADYDGLLTPPPRPSAEETPDGSAP